MIAQCDNETRPCGFYINLSQLHREALLHSDYAHIPTNESGRARPDMDLYIAAFDTRAGLQEDAPYFEGYCGEDDRKYPSVAQQAGLLVEFRTRIPVQDPPPSGATTRVQRPRVNNNGNKKTFLPRSWNVSQADRFSRMLDHGQGVSEHEFQCLYEQCDSCKRFYRTDKLKAHILSCCKKKEIIILEDSDDEVASTKIASSSKVKLEDA
ncbi:hypothetical protein EST38_g4467 [Candolleomyces aberdarensis]|uniref:Uncharacterized protein n=1 Tax=Candolleomyces aberdarensis TaxID=2316362 RepID=A0A4Q2DMI5_9AGAR|nr:hypothetical protein EST38_g4467 [Candolleomyces aberdarensis]